MSKALITWGRAFWLLYVFVFKYKYIYIYTYICKVCMYTHDNKGLSLPHGQPWSRLLQPFIDSHRGCEWGMLCLYWAITLHRATLQTSCQVPPSIPTHENASWKCVKDLQISQNLQHIPRNTLLPPWSYTFCHWLHTFGSYFYHRICPMPNTITTFQRVQKHSKKAQNIPNTSKIILKNTNFQNMPEHSKFQPYCWKYNKWFRMFVCFF